MRLGLGFLLACTAIVPFTAATAPAPDAVAEEPVAEKKSPLGTVIQALTNALIGPPPVDTEARGKVDDADGILRITDANYEQIFADGKPNDVWVIVAHGLLTDPTQVLFKDVHLNASKLLRGINGTDDGPVPTAPIAVEQGDHVFHFSRLDWVSDFVLSTRWVLTKPPYYLFISDNGKSIRSLWAPKAPPNGEWLYFLITKGYWEKLPVWKGSLGPGGKYAFLVETYIDLCQGWSKLTANVPRWGWLIVSMFSAAAVQRIVAWLHVRFGGAPAAAKIPRAPGAGQKAKTS